MHSLFGSLQASESHIEVNKTNIEGIHSVSETNNEDTHLVSETELEAQILLQKKRPKHKATYEEEQI
ncbi:19995_t:CDS:2 [Dentiscutata erythropus]|uniref:19995_t:CDS:1 n=1 Tax=Dentiscutata erythropus TaxID=1348616 RepID=A0A9N8WLQ4_9GLOM|nr:19995_t:CDS:2 [Dentiscutata erythropus]